MSGTRAFRAAATGARLLTGAVVAGACVVAVVLGVNASWPSIQHEPASAEVTPLPGDTVLVCNGDFRAIGRDPANPFQMVTAGSPALSVAGSSGTPESTPLVADDLAEGGSAQRLVGAVEGRVAPLLAATESISLAAEDLSGLAAAPCRPASQDSWIVGGSVETGTEDLIVLTNPGVVPSTVTLVAHGSVRASRTVIVPPESQSAVPLTSLAAGSDLPMVHVTATGSPVRAVLQSSLTRTLDPAGVDLQDAVSAPQQHAVLPGVRLFESQGDSGDSTVVRVMSPDADAQAVVTVSALGAAATAEEFDLPLTAGMPTELSLSALSPGEYTVRVDSDAPVLSAVRQQEGGGPQDDFAWVLPAPEIDDEVFAAIPLGPAPRLVLVNTEDVDATVRVEPVTGGDPVDVDIPAGSSTSIEVRPRTVYSLTGSGPIHASVTMTATGALAVWPLWPAAGTQQSIAVYP